MVIATASMHGPCIHPGTKAENTNAYIKCCENPLIHIIGHPDDGRYPVDFDALTDAALATHTLLELNNNSLDPDNFRLNTWENDREMLLLCKQKNVPIIIGSDAHFYSRVGAHNFAEQLIKETDFPADLVMNFYPEKIKSLLEKKY